jgi:hypothetical protein
MDYNRNYQSSCNTDISLFGEEDNDNKNRLQLKSIYLENYFDLTPYCKLLY